MEEEEARLKALLELTSDYDERKKIRAELRTVRMKKLDSLNNTAATESSERAARRAERARTRKAEQINGDASAAEKDSSSSGIVITDQILAEIYDEETLQKLLNEIPTSQYEDRRRIRARIREVKRSNTEGDPPSRSAYSRQTKEVTVTTEETSGITVKTTVETNGIETNDIEMNNHTGTADGGDVDFQVTIEQSKDVEIEQPNEPEPVPEPPEEVVADQSEDIPDEDDDKGAIEQAYETEQQDHESAEPEQEQPTKDEDAQEVVMDEESKDEEVIENGEGPPADDGPIEIQITLKVDETEEVNAEPPMEETIEQATEESPTFEQDEEISLDIKVDDEKITDIQLKEEGEEGEEERESVSPKPQENNNATDDHKLKQEQNNVKPSGWSTQEEEKAKKPGRINTLDFRGNLKKSGRISTGVVNLESRNTSSGAQVDFRSGLKQTGKSPRNIKSPGTTGRFSRSAQDSKGKVDFRVSLKKGESATGEASAGVKKDLPEKAKDLPEKAKDLPEKAKDLPEKAKDLPEKASKLNKPPKEIPPKPAPQAEMKENAPLKESPMPTRTAVVPESSVATPKVAEKQIKDSKNNNENKFSHKFSNAWTKASPAPLKKAKEFQTVNKSQKKVTEQATDNGVNDVTAQATDNGVNDVTIKVTNVSLAQKDVIPAVTIEVTEHEEDEGDTHTEVREVNTETRDGDDLVEEKKEVTKVSKTSTPGGGQFTTQTKQTTTTTRKGFMDPELQKRMASRQRERVATKREQVSSAKNKRMAFMQKLEANSPASQAPTHIKRSNSNVDKLLAWCRFKTRDYEGIKLSNFSSSWADGLAFCALLHLYLPDKIPYDELRAGNDKKRNFEVAFSVATDDGVPELLEVEDMMSVKNPEPKSVMTYVSSIYKHFNPS